MSRKRSEAAPAKTGRTWSPIKGLTLTERGPLQVQARVRRTRTWICSGPRSVSVSPLIGDQVRPVAAGAASDRLRGMFGDPFGSV